MWGKRVWYGGVVKAAARLLLATILLEGCTRAPVGLNWHSQASEQKIFVLKEITGDQGKTFLSEAGFGTVSSLPQGNGLLVTGSPSELRKASVILGLVDAKDKFVIKTFAPASIARTLPSNNYIARTLGDIAIGTFANPPQRGRQARAIIDIHGDAVLGIVPERYLQEILTIIESGPETVGERTESVQPYAQADSSPNQTAADEHPMDVCLGRESVAIPPGTSKDRLSTPAPAQLPLQHAEPGASSAESGAQVKAQPDSTMDTHVVAAEKPQALGTSTLPSGLTVGSPAKPNSEPQGTIANTSGRVAKPPPAGPVHQLAPLTNGDDILELDLPENMDLIQLFDLVGSYLHLNYMYDPNQIKGQVITLKLQGKLQGEIRVKDLYPLLESVLKFKGYVMARHKDNLMTIVPVADALEVDPQLVDPDRRTVEAGDIVVTRVFELRHIDTSSAMTLLENMKLSMAVSPVEETQTLIVTCYTHRISRIEQLLGMIDRPGRPRKFRFRQLKYTMAKALAKKVESLAEQLRTVPVAIALAQKTPPEPSQEVSIRPQPSPASISSQPISTQVPSRQTVYLDSDERTNRILMVGYEEQIAAVQELIDTLDVAQQDLRTLRVYNIEHVDAEEVKRKLEELEIIGRANRILGTFRTTPVSRPLPSALMGAMEGAALEEPQVVVLTATNSLLINASEEQHAQVVAIISYVDVAPEDRRTLQVYEIQHVEAEEVKTKLKELDLISVGQVSSPENTTTPSPAQPGTVVSVETSTTSTSEVLAEKPQVVVTEPTNSLLVNATTDQHAQIAKIISYVDSKISEEKIPYKIYPLENSSPDHVAQLLEQLIQETTKDKEDKIEKVRREEQITIVPDPNTFSLIVYASKKNQEWIENLIESLDKRRPQVLIDVTLVEITRTDRFEYDLNLVASTKEAVIDNIGIDPIHRIDSKSRLEGGFNMMDQEGESTGQTKAFYSDEKVQALLTAIERKNYGRVLAKPKILVDDGQEGKISTTDETTYVKESIQIPQQGIPITTRDFVPIQASIQLQINPHISEGNLLRLDVHLSRDDFGTRPQQGAPPDKATSEVTTTVFVPDNHTVILGGLVKLNQSKGGSKVPILGDIPLIGGLFRSVDNSDIERKLYVFLKANIVRPSEEARLVDLQKISEEHRKAFEKSEAEFQKHEDFPGIKPEPMQPERVLEEL